MTQLIFALHYYHIYFIFLVVAFLIHPAFLIWERLENKKPGLQLLKRFAWRTLAIAIFFFLFLVYKAHINVQCKPIFNNNYHLFNGHIKALCYERENDAECPKDRSELKAFNPRAFENLESCVHFTYHGQYIDPLYFSFQAYPGYFDRNYKDLPYHWQLFGDWFQEEANAR